MGGRAGGPVQPPCVLACVGAGRPAAILLALALAVGRAVLFPVPADDGS